MRRTFVVLASCIAVCAPGALRAQQPAAVPFDPDRVLLSDTTRFLPFNVTETRSLRAALDDGAVHDDTPLLVMEIANGALALLVEQMVYHHVAQGVTMGEPWMVSF